MNLDFYNSNLKAFIIKDKSTIKKRQMSRCLDM